jgi:pre-rRNA-processing protein TSR4
MDPSSDIVIGYITHYRPSKASRLLPSSYPSIIASEPVWLLSPPASPQIECSICSIPLTFLLQIYSPLSYPHSYHRTLFLFYCRSPICKSKGQGIVVLRAQNDENSNNLNTSQNEALINAKTPTYFIKTYILDEETNKQQLHLAEQNVADLQFKATDQEFEEFEEKELEKLNFDHEEELLQKYEQQEEEKGEINANEEHLFIRKIDPFFEKYKFLMELSNNREILRFSRKASTKPLWYCEKDRWNEEEVKNCENCGGKRIFEFQIQSSICNLREDLIDADWGIIAVYT